VREQCPRAAQRAPTSLLFGKWLSGHGESSQDIPRTDTYGRKTEPGLGAEPNGVATGHLRSPTLPRFLAFQYLSSPRPQISTLRREHLDRDWRESSIAAPIRKVYM